ncbi:MAG: RNA-binding protein, partial [Sulfuricurvum sp. 24-42-5]
MTPLITLLHEKTGISKSNIESILKLLDEGSTIPFIARYRKEMTGGATDEQLRDFETVYAYSKKLLERKEEIMRLILERGTLTSELKTRIEAAQTLQVLEDIYRPFKEKKNTRAAAAIAAGLEPLADMLQSGRLEMAEFKRKAQEFVKGSIESVNDAIKGSQDILAERYSDDPKERDYWRKQLEGYSSFEIKAAKGLKEDGLFAKLAGKSERIGSIPSHRYLAIMRGVAEKELTVKIKHEMDRVENAIKQYRIPKNAASSRELLLEAYMDGFKRLLFPSLEREIHSVIKERSDVQAITTFGKNLTQLLGSLPVIKRVILGADP